MHYQKCHNCGKRVKNYAPYLGNFYGMDCWSEIAKEFIEQRDEILNSPEYDSKTLNLLCAKYGVA